MKIVNKTRGTVLSSNAELRDSFLGRFRGLMLQGRKDAVLSVAGEGVLESTIHMMFMLYPIDVVWVDSSMGVVDVKRGVRPFNPLRPGTWGMHAPAAPAKYVVELGAGSVGETRPGDLIEFSR